MVISLCSLSLLCFICCLVGIVYYLRRRWVTHHTVDKVNNAVGLNGVPFSPTWKCRIHLHNFQNLRYREEEVVTRVKRYPADVYYSTCEDCGLQIREVDNSSDIF